MNPQVEWTGGGLVSTALNLARWGQRLYGGRVLAEETVRQMLDGVPVETGSAHKYGLGVMIRPSSHGLVVGHLGWVPGYVSGLAYYPNHGVAVAVQVNTDVGMSRMLLGTLLDDVASALVQR
jgi:D-alanyl-D-alanine carboxypeptidase